MKQIELTQGKFALVDDEDYDSLMQWKWYANSCGGKYYATRSIKMGNTRKAIRMHRQIMNPKINEQVDHIYHNTLDNRRSQLRICTSSQNNANRSVRKSATSKYLGISYEKWSRKWVAQIDKDKAHYWLGRFKNENEAAIAYNNKAIELHGDFANLNTIQ